MVWSKDSILIKNYKYTGSNQHGDHYKRGNNVRINTVKLSVEMCSPNSTDLQKLILFSEHLGVPVRYKFKDDDDDQDTAYIELVSREALIDAQEK